MKNDNYERAPELLVKLLEIMVELRDKCPWDKKQTFYTLRKLTIEETYELADAIIRKDMKSLKDELGDLMLHIVFYARVAEQQGAFNIEDVIETIIEKHISDIAFDVVKLCREISMSRPVLYRKLKFHSF